MKFAVGQEITPIRNKFNVVMMPEGRKNMPMPEFGKVYRVKGYVDKPWITGAWYLFLEGFPDDCIYNENSFAPLISDEELDEALKTESEMAEA